jgi:hypothetical protein
MQAICYLPLRTLPPHIPFLIAVLNINLLFLFCRKSEDGTQEGKKAFVKGSGFASAGYRPGTSKRSRRLTLVSSRGPGDRTSYNSWQTWPFPKIAVDRIAAAGALGLKAG